MAAFHKPSNAGGAGSTKPENPRSRVIPRSCDCGCLSNAAVDSSVLNARTSDVLPESTWPNTPMLIFMGDFQRLFWQKVLFQAFQACEQFLFEVFEERNFHSLTYHTRLAGRKCETMPVQASVLLKHVNAHIIQHVQRRPQDYQCSRTQEVQ